jgi:arginyl-tRNA synthetase
LEQNLTQQITGAPLNKKEVEIVKLLNLFPERIREAGREHSPAIIANYAYELAKEFNQYYHEVSILKEEDISVKSQRLVLIDTISAVLRKAMGILGISLPERM